LHRTAGAGARHYPEIRGADLSGLALETTLWGTPAESLRWLDPPPVVYDVRIEHRGGDQRVVRIMTPHSRQ